MAVSNPPERELAGSTWIAPYKQSRWPVVICDKSTAPAIFMQTRGGSRDLPAVLLGRHKYIWVAKSFLEAWDPYRDYLVGLTPLQEVDIHNVDDPEVEMENQRRTAFKLDVTFMKDHEYWHNYIVNQSEARKEDNLRKNKGSSNSWYRNDKYKPSTPRKKRSGATENDGDGDLRRLRTNGIIAKRSKNDDDDCFIVDGPSARGHSTSAKASRRRRSSTPEELPVARNSNRRNRRAAKIIESDPGSEDEPEIVVKASSAVKVLPKANPALSDSQQVKIIFCGPPSDSNLYIPKSSLANCKFLSDRCNFSIAHNCDIIPLEADIHAFNLKLTHQEMVRIIPFFQTNNLGPEFRTKSKNDSHPFGRLGNNLKGQYADNLGMAFVTASKISHVDLQNHILAKIYALFPLPDITLLTLAMIFSSLPPPISQAQVALGAWIIHHVVESYPQLKKRHPEVLERVLGENPELKAAVLERLDGEAEEEKGGLQDEVVSARAQKGKK